MGLKAVNLRHSKLTRSKRSEVANLPKQVVLPLSQHIGSPCKPLVKEGDYVKTGQKIAESEDFVSAPIHASISGTISKIDKIKHPITEKFVDAITIQGDEKDEKVEMHKSNWDELNADEIKELVKRAGVVGLGGAGFPTHVKLSPTKEVDTLIINGAECEPFLTTDHRLMLEKADALILGIRMIRRVLGVKKTFIGIEDNKKDAIRHLTDKCIGENIEIVKLKSSYPQGAEKTIIYSITKRKVPAGGLPQDIGVVCTNVGSAISVYEAVALSKPLYERLITVTGDVMQPKNLWVRNGMLIKDIINQCGGYKGEPFKVLNGGPMMGFAMENDEQPILRATSGLVVFNKSKFKRMRTECIRCGKCNEVCPMNLFPNMIADYAEHKRFDDAEKVHAMDCFECGNCSYVCPVDIPLVHLIRYAKKEVLKAKKIKKAQEMAVERRKKLAEEKVQNG